MLVFTPREPVQLPEGGSGSGDWEKSNHATNRSKVVVVVVVEVNDGVEVLTDERGGGWRLC